MLQLCAFAGYEGPLTSEKKIYFTIFGGCKLHAPTLARQMISAHRAGQGQAPTARVIFITFFGGTEIQCPTLAEEFVDLREAMQGGVLDATRWDAYLAELDQWSSAARMSLTLFGSFEEAHLPTEDQEVEGLALQHHFGKIDADSRRILEAGVGMAGSHRRSIIQQAALGV